MFKILRLISTIVKGSAHKTQSTHSVAALETNYLLIYTEIIAVCFQMRTEHLSTMYGFSAGICNQTLRRVAENVLIRQSLAD